MTETVVDADPDPDRPLVTFALFAYNQERYIREAVEGAFSQIYQPLEIILSDDCSSDRTYKIMQEMAVAYNGPHEVRVRQSSINCGTFTHLLDVAKKSNGEFLVVAAGDDISLPNRICVLVNQLKGNSALAISSDDIVIDSLGSLSNLHSNRLELRDKWHREGSPMLLGATAAYKTSLLKMLPDPDFKILNEDTVIQEILSITKSRVIYLRKPLIKRRTHEDNLEFKNKVMDSIKEKEISSIKRRRVLHSVMVYCIKFIEQSDIENKNSLVFNYLLNAKYFDYLSRWPELNMKERIEFLRIMVKKGKINVCLPRLFGWRVFIILKSGLAWRKTDG